MLHQCRLDRWNKKLLFRLYLLKTATQLARKVEEITDDNIYWFNAEMPIERGTSVVTMSYYYSYYHI